MAKQLIDGILVYDRAEYLAGNISHERYYSQFVNANIRAYVAKQIGKARIISNTDPHFNTIPLSEWDNLTGICYLMKGLAWRFAEGNYWSLNSQICIAKCSANIIRQIAINPKENDV